MKIDPRHLEIIAAVVDKGGLTEGAHAVGRAQPSVSRTIAMLEARIGVALFDKDRRPLKPTELCLALAAEGRRIVGATKAAAAIIDDYKSGQYDNVRIGGTPLFMDGVIAPKIAEFQQAFPDVRIEQSYGYTGELMERLTSGMLDIAICPMNVAMIPEGFRFTQLLPGRNVIACGHNHPLLMKASLRLSDIALYPWIAPPVSSPLYQDMRIVLADIGIREFKISFSGGSLASVTSILSHSDALTVLPYSVVFMARRARTLSALSIRIGHPERSLGILSLSSSETERASVRRLKQFLESEFRTFSQVVSQHEKETLRRF